MLKLETHTICLAIALASVPARADDVKWTTPPGGQARLDEMFQKWDSNWCTGRDKTACWQLFGQSWGLPMNPDVGGWDFDPSKLRNPDPTWIRDWDKVRVGRNAKIETIYALAGAATGRAWWVSCEAQFEKQWDDMTKRRQAVDAAIEAANAKSPSERLEALLAIPLDPANDAPRFDLERALATAFAEADRAAMYAAQIAPKRPPVRDELPKEDAKVLFCLKVERRGISGSGHHYLLNPLLPWVPRHPAMTDEARKRLNDAVAAKESEADAMFAAVADAKRTSGTGTIKHIDRKGSATILHLYDEEKHTVSDRDNCTTGDTVYKREGDNYRATKDVNCAGMEKTLVTNIDLAIDGAAPDVAVGDKIQFYAVAGKTTHKDSKKVATEQASYDRGYIAARWRKGTVAMYPEIKR